MSLFKTKDYSKLETVKTVYGGGKKQSEENIIKDRIIRYIRNLFKQEDDYCISSDKRRASNKRCTFEYPHGNKHPLLISTSPLISAAPLNTALIRIVTIFH